MTLRVKINFLLLAVLLLSTAYVAQVFVSSYQAELNGQKAEAATVRNDQAEQVLQGINFDIPADTAVKTADGDNAAALPVAEKEALPAKVNRLVVNSMSVNAVIYEGQTDKTL